MTYPEEQERRLAAFRPSWERLEKSTEAAIKELQRVGMTPDEAVDNAAMAVAIAKWRKSRVVYKIDPELAESLIQQAVNTQDSDIFPADLLLNLPFPCIAVQLPAMQPSRIDKNRNRVYGRVMTGNVLIYIDGEDLATIYEFEDPHENLSYFFPVQAGKTIGEMRKKFKADIAAIWKDPQEFLRSFNLPDTEESLKFLDEELDCELYNSYIAIQIILYLQAKNSDIVKIPAPPRKKRSSTGKKPKPVKNYSVGYNIGAAIRREKRIYERSEASEAQEEQAQSGENDEIITEKKKRRSPRDHFRAGHFKLVAVGPRAEHNRELRWIAPTYVHGSGDNGLVTIRPVK